MDRKQAIHSTQVGNIYRVNFRAVTPLSYIGLFEIGGRKTPDDDVVDHDAADMINNMGDKGWEPLPYPIIIDSGAFASVIPSKRCLHIETRPTILSKKCNFSTAASGGESENEGESSAAAYSAERSTVRAWLK